MASVSGPTRATKDTRLHVRCRSEDKDKIEHAAQALGLSVSDYLLSSALAHANRTDEGVDQPANGAEMSHASTGLAVARDHEAVRSRLGEADTKSLLALIFMGEAGEEAGTPTPRMRRAVERYNQRVLGAKPEQTGADDGPRDANNAVPGQDVAHR